MDILWKPRIHQITKCVKCAKKIWARLYSFSHLGLINDPFMVTKFHNRIHDSKRHENKINIIVKGRDMFYCRHTVLVPVTSCRETIYVFKRFSVNTDLRKNDLSQLLVLESTQSLCIKPEVCIVFSAIRILTGCDTTTKVGTKFSVLKPPAVLLSEFGKSLSSPLPFKMKSYAKLSNNLFKYSNLT